MIIKGDQITFESTGRTEYANAGIIGLSPALDVFCGYDDEFYCADDPPEAEGVSESERSELANYMIQQWEAFRDQQHNVEGKTSEENQ